MNQKHDDKNSRMGNQDNQDKDDGEDVCKPQQEKARITMMSVILKRKRKEEEKKEGVLQLGLCSPSRGHQV